MAFSLNRSNIIDIDERPDPELFEGVATGPVTDPAMDEPRKDELLDVMPPLELTLQVPAARTTFSERRAPLTGTAAAKPILAAKIAANAAVAAVAERIPLGADEDGFGKFISGSLCPVRETGGKATKAPVRGNREAAKIVAAPSAAILIPT